MYVVQLILIGVLYCTCSCLDCRPFYRMYVPATLSLRLGCMYPWYCVLGYTVAHHNPTCREQLVYAKPFVQRNAMRVISFHSLCKPQCLAKWRLALLSYNLPFSKALLLLKDATNAYAFLFHVQENIICDDGIKYWKRSAGVGLKKLDVWQRPLPSVEVKRETRRESWVEIGPVV